MEQEDTNIPQEGEITAYRWNHRFIDLSFVPAQTRLVPALIDTEAGRLYAALQLAISDLAFSQECFAAADRIGIPSFPDIQSRSLITSAIISYARPFMTGTRPMLHVAMFDGIEGGFDAETHSFLVDLRNRHTAHSVNTFENACAAALMVQPPHEPFTCRGIGHIEHRALGINRQIVRKALTLLTAMLKHLDEKSTSDGDALFHEFRRSVEGGAEWTVPPIATAHDRTKVGGARKSLQVEGLGRRSKENGG